MSQKPQNQKKPKKLSKALIAWVIFSISLLGLGVILYQSKPTPIRYKANPKPFVLPTIGIEENTEEVDHEVKEEELMQLTQPKSTSSDQSSSD